MTDAGVSQVSVEVLRTNLAATAVSSQLAVEVIRPNAGLSYKLSCDVGSYTYTGKSSTFVITAFTATGSFALTGNAANLSKVYLLSVESGVLVFDGKSVNLNLYVPNILFANAGEFTLNGNRIVFRPELNGYAGSFAITVQSARLLFGKTLRVNAGEYNISGNDISFGLTTGSSVYCAKGEYSFSGKSSTLRFNTVWNVDAGEYELNYSSAAFRRNRTLKCQKATYSLSGQSNQFRRPRLIFSVFKGEYSLGMNRGYPFKNSVGPFFFAWTDAIDDKFSNHHLRYDETVFSFRMTHEEGQVPTLEIEIKNPQTGLLNASRQQWAWLSWDDGVMIRPLFYGRLVGVPGDILGPSVTLQFVARSNDYLDRKNALAQSLKVAPYYEPLFLDEKSVDDADAILEAYSASWHVDRTSLDWTVSDIITPEDGVVIFDPADVFYDSVQIGVGAPPLRKVDVSTNVAWKNSASVSKSLGAWTTRTYLGSSLIGEWPKPGTEIGGGWTADNSYCFDIAGVERAQVVTTTNEFRNGAMEHIEGDTMSASTRVDKITNFSGSKHTVDRKIEQTWGPSSASGYEHITYALEFFIMCGLSVRANSDRSFGETARLSLAADVQDVLFDSNVDQEAEVIEINAREINSSDTHYFPTDAGYNAIAYMVMRARARLLTRARAIDVSWQTTLKNGIDLSCRKGAQISDPRIPGGVASGKITSYTLRGDGETGEFTTDVRIGVAVGNGAAIVTPNAGVDTYADNYVASGYTVRTGVVAAIGSSGVGFTPPTDPQIGGVPSGASAVLVGGDNPGFAQPYLHVELPDISILEFAAEYDVNTTILEVPKGIDLGAAHVP